MERLRQKEDENRNKNFKFVGIAEISGENSNQTQNMVQKLVSQKLHFASIQFVEAYRIGKHITQNTIPMNAELRTVNNKFTCFKSSKLLEGTDIYLNDDASKASAHICRQKIATLKEERKEGFIVYYFRGAGIITKRRRGVTLLQLSTTPDCLVLTRCGKVLQQYLSALSRLNYLVKTRCCRMLQQNLSPIRTPNCLVMMCTPKCCRIQQQCLEALHRHRDSI